MASGLERSEQWVMKLEGSRHKYWGSLLATVYFSLCTVAQVSCYVSLSTTKLLEPTGLADQADEKSVAHNQRA